MLHLVDLFEEHLTRVPTLKIYTISSYPECLISYYTQNLYISYESGPDV